LNNYPLALQHHGDKKDVNVVIFRQAKNHTFYLSSFLFKIRFFGLKSLGETVPKINIVISERSEEPPIFSFHVKKSKKDPSG
jgi:hypothetical protein